MSDASNMPKDESNPKTIQPHQWTNDGDRVLVLRRCNPDGTSYEGYKWDLTEGAINRPEHWSAARACGSGLHGSPWGMGLGEGSDFSVVDDVFVVFSAKPEDVVGGLDNGYKCKAKEATVVASGSFGKCWELIEQGRHALIEAMARCEECSELAEGYSSTAASSGFSSKAASSGYSSKAASSGYSSTAASSGDYSTAASSGDSSTAASSGDYSTAASSGDYSTAASSGDYSTAASSGYSSKAASSGDSSTAASSGDYSTAASSGYSSTAASSGFSSRAASSGFSSKAASSGDYSKAASSGDSSTAAAIGNKTIAAVAGLYGQAKVGEGGVFALPFQRPDGSLDIAVGRVGHEGIRADTWYAVNEDGELYEATP